MAFQNEEEFLQALLKLPKEKQEAILNRAFELVYASHDDKVYRVMATAIKYAKESGSDGHEEIQIGEQDLKRLSGIQDLHRHQDKRKS